MYSEISIYLLPKRLRFYFSEQHLNKMLPSLQWKLPLFFRCPFLPWQLLLISISDNFNGILHSMHRKLPHIIFLRFNTERCSPRLKIDINFAKMPLRDGRKSDPSRSKIGNFKNIYRKSEIEMADFHREFENEFFLINCLHVFCI